MSLDSTLFYKEETRFRNKYASLLKEVAKKSHFTPKELDALSLIYYKIQRESTDSTGLMARSQFRSIMHICLDMPEDTLIERIMYGLDRNVTTYITLETWLDAFSLWLRGTLPQKIKYCFKCYDFSGEEIIKRDFMIKLLKKSVVKQFEEDLEEAVKDFVYIVMKRLDIDRDGAISFADYRDSVKNTPELLECLGKCLPSEDCVYAFLTTFTDKIKKP